jgi:hypothetical protein
MSRRAPHSGQREDLSHPSPWRLQHGDLASAQRVVNPETGASVAHRRVVDLLGRLEANGTITGAMRDAGRVFHAHFRAAALDTLRTAPLLRPPAGTGETMTERTVHARRKVMAALDALGGMDSAAGSCVWHVVGCEASIREWAARQGWGGRRVGHAQAQGILVAALGVLAGHYRLAERAHG